MKTKAFDCVKMTRLGAEKVREKTAAMTKEEVRFWQERSRELRQRREKLDRQRNKVAA
jgi:FtsZ-binding cell division protein ZapB